MEYLIVEKGTCDVFFDKNTVVDADFAMYVQDWYGDLTKDILQILFNRDKIDFTKRDFLDTFVYTLDRNHEQLEVIDTQELAHRESVDELDIDYMVKDFLNGIADYIYDGYNKIYPVKVVDFRPLKTSKNADFRGGLYKADNEFWIMGLVEKGEEIVDCVFECFESDRDITLQFGEFFSMSFNVKTFLQFLGLENNIVK